MCLCAQECRCPEAGGIKSPRAVVTGNCEASEVGVGPLEEQCVLSTMAPLSSPQTVSFEHLCAWVHTSAFLSGIQRTTAEIGSLLPSCRSQTELQPSGLGVMYQWTTLVAINTSLKTHVYLTRLVCLQACIPCVCLMLWRPVEGVRASAAGVIGSWEVKGSPVQTPWQHPFLIILCS